MGYRAHADCIHIDNWRRCKVHQVHWLVRWMLPKGRPPCVFEYDFTPQDGDVVCAEQVHTGRGRPPGPAPMAKND